MSTTVSRPVSHHSLTPHTLEYEDGPVGLHHERPSDQPIGADMGGLGCRASRGVRSIRELLLLVSDIPSSSTIADA